MTSKIQFVHKNLPKMPKTEMKRTATPSIQKDQILSFRAKFRNVGIQLTLINIYAFKKST